MTPLRIATIGHSYVVSLNRAVMDRVARHPGIDLTVVAPEWYRGDFGPLSLQNSRDAPYQLTATRVGLSRHVHVFRYRDLSRQLAGQRFDILHAWEEPYILAGYQLARFARTTRTRFVFQTCQNLAKNYPWPFAAFERFCVENAAGWTGIGHQVQQVQRGRGYPEPSAVVPLGIDETRFRPDPATGVAVRRRLGLSGPVVGFVGRLTPEKGLDVLTAALDTVSPPWSLLVLGGGPQKETLLRWAEARGIEDRVRIELVGHEEVPAFLQAIDVLVAPSLTRPNWCEQFGRMIVEAFACGIPVIGSDSGEIPFVIGDAGIVVPEGRADALAEALNGLLQSPERRRQLALAGEERCQAHYTSARAAELFVEFSRRVMDTPRG